MRRCSECGGLSAHTYGCPDDDGDTVEPNINEDDSPQEREYDYEAQLDRAQAARDRQYEAWGLKR